MAILGFDFSYFEVGAVGVSVLTILLYFWYNNQKKRKKNKKDVSDDMYPLW
jgi:hypothetical protein